MILHTIDLLYLWAPNQNQNQMKGEIRGAVTSQGIVDIDLLSGPNCEAIRGIVKSSRELSLRYLLLVPLTGTAAVQKFLVKDVVGEQAVYSIWVRQAKLCLGEGPDRGRNASPIVYK
jgi:hypothetical protein